MTPRVPLAIGILVAIAMLLAVGRFAPDLLEAVIALLVLYLVATNVHRAQALFEAGPAALDALFGAPATTLRFPPGDPRNRR